MRHPNTTLRIALAATTGALVLTTAFGVDRAQAAGSVKIADKALIVEGGAEADRLALRVPRSAPHLLQVDLGDDGSPEHELRRDRFERIVVEAGAGDDTVRIEGPSLEPVALSGGDGLDALTVEGSRAADRFRLSAKGPIVRLSRDAGDLRVTGTGVENVDIPMHDGADALEVEDLTGTELQQIQADLGPTDGQVDRVSVDGSNEQEQILILGSQRQVSIVGSPVFMRIDDAESVDRLRVDGRRGDDLVGNATAAMSAELRGGEGTDTLSGGPGDDLLVGGDGFDDVSGGPGDDRAYMGDQADRFTWAPGDGSDVVEGGGGRDSMFFVGNGQSELFGLTADGRRLRFTRDAGSIAMDLDDVEEIGTMALGGADTIGVGDLRRTDVQQVDVNLAPAFGSPAGDGAADWVVVTGTPHRDEISVGGQNGAVTVRGLSAQVGITHAEPLDTLAIRTAGGEDRVDSSELAPDTIGLAPE